MDESLPPPIPPAAPTNSAPPTPPYDRVVVAVGVALLAAAVALSGVYTRKDGDIDWTNYLVGIAATLALLGIAAVSVVRLGTRVAQELVSWPGALGTLGVGSMLGIALDDADFSTYVIGIVVLALSAGGYLVCHTWPFVLTAIAGFGAVYAQLFDDVFDAADLEGDNVGMVISIALLIFAVLVTGATWFLPERVLGGVVAGIVAAVGNFLILVGLAVAVVLAATFGSLDMDDPFEAGAAPQRLDTYDNDVYVVLVVALVLVAGWAWCAWQTGHVGFRILIVGICATVLPMATIALAVEHPSVWGAVVGVLGTCALGWLVLRGLRPSPRPQP
jgi:hypothetical protein